MSTCADCGRLPRLLPLTCWLLTLFAHCHGATIRDRVHLHPTGSVFLQTALEVVSPHTGSDTVAGDAPGVAGRSTSHVEANPHGASRRSTAATAVNVRSLPSSKSSNSSAHPSLSDRLLEAHARRGRIETARAASLGDLAAILPITSISWVKFTGTSQVLEGWLQSTSNLRSVLTEELKEDWESFLESPPIDMAAQGSRVFAKKAGIAADAMKSATTGSVKAAWRGNFTGVVDAAKTALNVAMRRNAVVNSTMSRASSQGLGVLMVLVIVLLLWITELLVSVAHPWLLQRMHRTSRTSGGEDRVEDIRVAESEIPQNFLHGLTFMRYLMSWFVIVDTFYKVDEENDAWAVFARWGRIAAPWFYMLSGFDNSYSKLTSSTPNPLDDDFVTAALRRIATWYPFFLFGLLWCAVGDGLTSDAQSWSHFLSNIFLVHRLAWGEDYFPHYTGDWWLSFFVVYLFTWAPIHQALSESTNSILWTLFAVGWFATVPIAILEWAFMQRFPIFTMIQYWPSFAYGQALAVWFVSNCMQKEVNKSAGPRVLATETYVLKPAADLPVVVRYGPTPIIISMCSFFFLVSPNDTVFWFSVTWEPVFVRGGLLPVFAVLMVGLACRVDPLARLFSRTPFRWFGKLALLNYFVHVPLRRTYARMTGAVEEDLSWGYAAILVLTTTVMHYTLEAPWRRLLGVYEK
mmetsp:Transcript_30025/g.69946  ORF Transcript_30025/g.69946 Transcript_30025/m.69946 type:complete len:689 (+) Transcript_30025:198-2264(+)